MRSTSIIHIIRKYGLNSKRLNPKNKIKYQEAIKALKGYESADLEISSIIDNKREHSHCNGHCQVPGCGQKIRYEYILKNKKSAENLIAGSTCVWPLLGLSELESKDFFRYDQAIRDYYLLQDWKEENPDVVEKLEKLKENNVFYYRAFWEEIESSRLTDEDTEFIKNVDLDKELEKVIYDRELKKISDDEYNRAIAYLPELVAYSKGDGFISSLDRQVRCGKRLSGNQLRWLKVSINRMWYNKNIKGTKNDILSSCEDYLQDVFRQSGFKGSSTDFEAIDLISELVKGSRVQKLAWNLYKIKKAIVH